MGMRTSAALRCSAPAGSRPASVVGIDSGDHRARVREARNALAKAHAGMVRAIAERVKQRCPPSIELDDLIQTGMVALLHAATRYRPAEHSGAPFAVYARKCVRGAMLDSISGRHWQAAKLDPLPDTHRDEPAIAPVADEAIDDARLARRIDDAIAYLDEPSREIIRQCYRGGATLEAAGAAMGLDRRRAGELRADAIAELRRILHV